MRPCYFYAKNIGKEGFSCAYEELEGKQYLLYKNNKDFILLNTYCNKYCPNFENCVKLADETFRATRKANVIVNRFADGKISVLRKDTFSVPARIINDKADRSRSFLKVNGNLLIPRKKVATPAYLKKNEYRSGRRAKDVFYGYALSNSWTYFFTFTFSPALVEHRYDSAFTNLLWQRFQQKFKHWDILSILFNKKR